MKKKYFLIIGLLLLIIFGSYFGINKFSSRSNKYISKNQEIKSASSKDLITKKQAYDFQKNEIIFHEDNQLIGIYNLKKNNPFEGNSKYNVLKSFTNINTPNEFDYRPNYIIVSYHATEKNIDDFDFLTTIEVLNLNGYKISTIELNKTRFIAKSISADLKYLYGIQLTKNDLNDDYHEYKPALLDLETKINLLNDIKDFDSFKYSENVYGIFPSEEYLLLAIDNKYIENIKLLDLKEKKIVWSEQASLNKFSIKVDEGIINIIDDKNQNIITTKKINQ